MVKAYQAKCTCTGTRNEDGELVRHMAPYSGSRYFRDREAAINDLKETLVKNGIDLRNVRKLRCIQYQVDIPESELL